MYLSVAGIIMLLIAGQASTCLTSSEEYASEVVISSYASERLSLFGEETTEGLRGARSQYSSNLISIISPTNFPNGLSVRLQLPTEIDEQRRPYIKLASYSSHGTLRQSLQPLFNGWRISCESNECIFEKDLITLTASRTPREPIVIEIEKDLQSCNQCSGACFQTASGSRCLDIQTTYELSSILRYANLSTGINQTLTDYRIIGSEDLVLVEIVRSNSALIDWEEAMRQELVYLNELGIINLARSDIESIASKANVGQAGRNYRIVYDSQEWKYYNQVQDSVLTQSRDCRAYEIPVVSQSETTLNPFYLIPFLITLGGVIILFFLVIIARIANHRHHKVKTAKKV